MATFPANDQLAYHILFDHDYCNFCSKVLGEETHVQHIAACKHTKCTKSDCARLFPNSNSYKNHIRTYHQDEIKLFYSDESTNPQFEVIQKINGYFKCLCGKQYSKATSITTHWRRKCGINSQNNVQEGRNVRQRTVYVAESEPDSDEESDQGSQDITSTLGTFMLTPSEISDLVHMETVPLAFNQKFGLMLCTLCNESLINRNSMSIFNHLNKYHSDLSNINPDDIENFFEHCNTTNSGSQLVNESYIRAACYGNLLEPIEGVKVFKEGFR